MRQNLEEVTLQRDEPGVFVLQLAPVWVSQADTEECGLASGPMMTGYERLLVGAEPGYLTTAGDQ